MDLIDQGGSHVLKQAVAVSHMPINSRTKVIQQKFTEYRVFIVITVITQVMT